MSPKVEYKASKRAVLVSMLISGLFLIAVFSGFLKVEFIPKGGAPIALHRNVLFLAGVAIGLVILTLAIDRIRWGRRYRNISLHRPASTSS